MSYSSEMLDKRIGVWSVDRENMDGKSGRGSGGVRFKQTGCVCGSVKWNRGQRAMMEGALEAYDVVMIRMRYDDGYAAGINKDCRLTCDGKTYQIHQMMDDRRDNVIQIIAQQTNEQLGK